MDPNLSTIIVTIITGVFTVITLIIQKRQDKMIKKIDEQTLFIEKEKGLKQELTEKKEERRLITHEMMILILDTNLSILNIYTQNNDINIDNNVFEKSKELKKKYETKTEEIEDITKEYEIILDMTSQFQHEIQNQHR